ncbi:hypothetical protein HKI87_09g57560 [Chloropicon roscoffensis]|uniref:Uncharacterized protein n=1 Tax=Chloropicon roscoffensis TaxID=1461544 RepID=A0AAX4PDX5_9CHLO
MTGRTAGPRGRWSRARCRRSAPCERASGPSRLWSPGSADTSGRSAKRPITSELITRLSYYMHKDEEELWAIALYCRTVEL